MVIIYESEAMDRHATTIFDLMQFLCNQPIETKYDSFTQKLHIYNNNRVGAVMELQAAYLTFHQYG